MSDEQTPPEGPEAPDAPAKPSGPASSPPWWTHDSAPTPPQQSSPTSPPAWSRPDEPTAPTPPAAWSRPDDITQSQPTAPQPTFPTTPPAGPTEPASSWSPPAASAWPPQAASSWPPPTPPQGQGPTPQWPTQPPTSWPPSPPGVPPYGGWAGPGAPYPGGHPGQWPAPKPSPTKRVVAVVAAIALVIASAGIGALVAVAVHKDSPTSSASGNGNNGFTFPTFPNFGNGNNGNGNNGSGSSSSSGPLDANAVASKVTPAIVNINTTLDGGRAAGTGIVISANGAVLTNNHVIADATSIKVDIGGGDSHSAHVVGYDVGDDIALLQIDNVSNMATVTVGDPAASHIGDPVVAIGNALGKGGSPTVTQGKITAVDQDVTAGDAQGGLTETLHHMIQIDAQIQPGNSGGPLVNAQGQVIGINTAAASGRFSQQTGSNIGFSIRIDSAIGVIRTIQSGKESNGVHIGGERALLGVRVSSPDQVSPTAPFNVAPVNSGAVVVQVEPNSAASDVGMQAGDVIVGVDTKNVDDQNALHLALTEFHPGDKVPVTWVDANGDRHTETVTLGEGPPA
jgi:S1-C subfamily serine protease